MVDSRPRALVAASASSFKEVGAALGEAFHVSHAPTLDDAVRRFHDEDPEVIIVGYHFDEMRPFRFIRYVRDDRHGAARCIVLVLAVPLRLRTGQQAAIRDAYRSFGADEFFNLVQETERQGRENALATLRQILRRSLRRRKAGAGRCETH